MPTKKKISFVKCGFLSFAINSVNLKSLCAQFEMTHTNTKVLSTLFLAKPIFLYK